jgi:hypothetical protein
MKWIKTYEELKPETYISAADKLSKMGHKKRPEKLISWSKNMKEKNLIESIKSIGDFDINLDNEKLTTYIYLHLDKDDLNEQLIEWSENDTTCLLPIDIAVFPVNYRDKEILENFGEIYYNSKIGVYFVSRIWINISIPYSAVTDRQLSEIGIKKPIDINSLRGNLFPSGQVYIDNTHETNFYFSNRKSAIKFKKSLIEIFNGVVDYRSTDENPGGFKDEVFDHLGDEWAFDIGQLLRFMDSLQKIRINDLYRD